MTKMPAPLSERDRALLVAVSRGEVTVNSFDHGIEAKLHVLLPVGGYSTDASRYVAALVERHLVARPRYTRYSATAKLTKAGRDVLGLSVEAR